MQNPCPMVWKCSKWLGPTHNGAQILVIKAQPIDGVRPEAAPGALSLGLPRVMLLESVAQGGWQTLRLNTGTKLIVNKYCKGRLKITLKRGFKRAWSCERGMTSGHM